MCAMNEKRIQESARGEDCTVRLPGICCFNPETTVFAHLNGVRFGHGVGKKTRWGCYACHSCHLELDRRTTLLDKDVVKMAHYEAVIETLDKLVEKGLI
jgi:hypothetical protein